MSWLIKHDTHDDTESMVIWGRVQEINKVLKYLRGKIKKKNLCELWIIKLWSSFDLFVKIAWITHVLLASRESLALQSNETAKSIVHIYYWLLLVTSIQAIEILQEPVLLASSRKGYMVSNIYGLSSLDFLSSILKLWFLFFKP